MKIGSGAAIGFFFFMVFASIEGLFQFEDRCQIVVMAG